MSTHQPPSSPRPGGSIAATPVSGATPPRSAGARTGSSMASSAKSAGKSTAHKASSGQAHEVVPSLSPSGNPAKSAPAVSPTSAPKPPAALHHLTSRDGALERLLQAKARLRGATTKTESASPAHSAQELSSHGRGGSSSQSLHPSHAKAAGSGQTVRGNEPVQAQIGDHKARQGLTHPTSAAPQSGDATFIQRMLAHGLSHQASAAGAPKGQHPLAGPGVTGLKR